MPRDSRSVRRSSPKLPIPSLNAKLHQIWLLPTHDKPQNARRQRDFRGLYPCISRLNERQFPLWAVVAEMVQTVAGAGWSQSGEAEPRLEPGSGWYPEGEGISKRGGSKAGLGNHAGTRTSMNKLIFANLVQRPVRSIISVLAVAIEVIMILSIAGIFMGMLNDTKPRTNGIGADLMVCPPGLRIS